MSRALDADAATDVAEFCLSSAASPSVCVYRRDRLRTAQVQKLMRRIGLAKPVEDFFWVVLARIPAERHAVRLSLDNAFSIFFKTDVPRQRIGDIAAAIGLETCTGIVLRHFADAQRDPCGIGFEVDTNGSPRMRLYDNVDRPDQPLTLVPGNGRRILRDVSGDRTASPSILNLSMTRDGATAKIEAPDVTLGEPPRARLSPGGNRLFAMTRDIMANSGISRLNYFGLRFRGRNHEPSCYLDAFRAAL